VTAISRRHLARLAVLAATLPGYEILAGTNDLQLAIKGYDAVAYFTLSKPTKGLPEITYDWDELRYHFASTQHRDLFEADPARYAPQFANYCAMALTRGETDEANPENWLVRDGKLFIFGKPIGPGVFQQAYNENVAKAGGNRQLIPKR
jgi:hypothetical protein